MFGLVGQEPYLFNNTIKYNIQYNYYDMNDQQMRDAAQISNAVNFIEKDEEFAGEIDKNNTIVGNKDEKEKDNSSKNSDHESEAVGYERNVGVKGSK